jgi:acetyl-CoA carboxylase carboxyl transferase subunit beta
MNARERIASLTSSFDERDTGLQTTDPLAFEGYAEQLAGARGQTGIDDACIWGFADIAGVHCALVVFDFDFMGGSMGMAAGEKVARAFDAATDERTPVVTVTASGGARMQEGMWSLVQMAKTVEARRTHRDAGLAHLTLLTSPTTGGVYASFASLADVVLAETGTTVGFAGPRVVAQLTGEAPPPQVHTVSFALEHGLVDAVVEAGEAAEAVATAIRMLAGATPASGRRFEVPDAGRAPALSAWDRLQAVRDETRIKGGEVLDALLSGSVELRGDRQGGGDDEHVVARVGSLEDGSPVVAIAQNAVGDGRIRPEGFRKTIRALDLAGRLGHSVVVVIDTRGADPLPGSEGGGIAVAIAQTFEAMLACPSPTLAVLVGEGGSGGALAMAVTDRVIACENAVFSVIAPEGAAAILYRDAGRASELAERLRITVEDLVELGLVDVVVPEPADGVAKQQVNMPILAQTVIAELDRLVRMRPGRRLAARHRRYRNLAGPSTGQRSGR